MPKQPIQKEFVLFDEVLPPHVFGGARGAGQWSGHCGGGINMEESKRANCLVDECIKDPKCFTLVYFYADGVSPPTRVEHYFCKHHYIVEFGLKDQRRFNIFTHPLTDEILTVIKCFQVPQGGRFTFDFYEKQPTYFCNQKQKELDLLAQERKEFEEEKRKLAEERKEFETEKRKLDKNLAYYRGIMNTFQEELSRLYP